MKNTVLVILLVLLVSDVSFAQNYSVCERLIDRGLREYDIERSSEANYSSVFDNYCEQDGSRKQSSAGGGIDLVIKAIPIGIKGNSDSNEEQMKNFCKNYSSVRQSNRVNSSYRNTIADKAYDAFGQCVKFVSQGVSIEHNLINKQAVSLFFLGRG
jgi:hypothetical protein